MLKSNIPMAAGKEKFIKISDEIVVLPKITALDGEAVKKLITKSFDLILSEKKEGKKDFQTKVHMKYSFIRNLQNRVNEIEKELIEERKEIKKAKRTGGKSVSNIQLLKNTIEEWKMLYLINYVISQNKGSSVKAINIRTEVTDSIIEGEIDRLIARIKQVRKLFLRGSCENEAQLV